MSAEELESLVGLLRSHPRPENPTVELMRERFDGIARLLPAPDDARCDSVEAGGVPAEMVSAPNASASHTVLYLHGGGYVVGSPSTHRNLGYNLSAASGFSVLLLDYRLAPEAPYPAQVEDAVAAYRWLLSEGFSAENIAIAGDSAGGGLAVATLVALKEGGHPLPRCAVCMSPWVDMESLGASMETKAALDPMVQRENLLSYADMFLNGADPRSPLAAPHYADLSNLPPTLIQVGTSETLLDDSIRLAEKAQAAGTAVTLEQWDNMIHVWQLFAPMLSEGGEAIAAAGAFLKSHAP